MFIRTSDLYLLLVIALMKWAAWGCPRRLNNILVHGIALVASWFSLKKRRIAEALGAAFDEQLTSEQKRRIMRHSFYSFWDNVFSLALSERDKSELKEFQLTGLEHLQSALLEKKGAILWESSFFGKRNLAKLLLRENGFSLCQVHGAGHLGGLGNRGTSTWLRREVIKPFFERCEMQSVAEILYISNVHSLTFSRTMLERLRRNAILCVSGDVGVGHKFVCRPFLGRKQNFATGIVSLARISGTPILPMFCLEEPDGKNHLLIGPALKTDANMERDQNHEAIVSAYSRLLESHVLGRPEQYYGWHLVNGSPEQWSVID